MELLNLIIVNIILITFPILLYFFYIVYVNIKNNMEYDIFLPLTLIGSLYLCFKFGNPVDNNIILLLCIIPVVIAYIKKRHFLAMLLSLIIIIYAIYVAKYELYIIMIIKFISYAILYFFKYYRKNVYKMNFINNIAILQGFFISFEYFLLNSYQNIIDVIYIFAAVIIIYSITFAILYIFKIADDISKLYLSYKELEQDKQIKESLFKITHEIKNPLAVCKGYIDMFNIDNKEKSLKYISIIKGEIERTLNILTDLSELNKVKVDRELMDLNILLEEIINSISLLCDRQNITINYRNSHEIYVLGDYNKLKQVFINILKNCYEAIEGDGTIDIKVICKDSICKIIIKDNGKGMDQETLKRIGEIFYTTKKNGTGIGVTLSKEIMKSHNGRIEYESSTNFGTTTTVTIPLTTLKK